MRGTARLELRLGAKRISIRAQPPPTLTLPREGRGNSLFAARINRGSALPTRTLRVQGGGGDSLLGILLLSEGEHTVEDSVDELGRLAGAVALSQLDRLVDGRLRRHVGEK